MSDGPSMTKRERQQQRRRERRERERAAAARARRRRFAVIGVAVIVVLALIGWQVQRVLAERAARQERAAAAAAKIDELGCTEVERPPDLGAGHLPVDAASLEQAPPQALYPDRPTTSGEHIGQVAASGIYDQPVDERLTTHNLEHGYTVFWYDEDADPSTVEELKSWAQERLDNGFPKIIVAPYLEPLPGDADVVSVAWHARQSCEQFDADVAHVFLDEYHGDSGEAPEKGAPPHQSAEGVPGPGSERGLLFPPLDEGRG